MKNKIAKIAKISVGQILHGNWLGLLLILVLALPISYAVTETLYSHLNLWAMREIEARCITMEATRPKRVMSFESVNSTISREFVAERKLAKKFDPKYGVDFEYGKHEEKLLVAYMHTVDEKDAGEFYPGVIRIEVTLQHSKSNEWRVLLDIGIQEEPNQWLRIPWWEKEGIAKSNEIIRVSKRGMSPVWHLETPTTAEAACAYINDYFLAMAKERQKLVEGEAKVNPLIEKYRKKEFESDVIHPIMSILPKDFGGLTVGFWTFLFNTLNGPLQACMLYCFVAATLTVTIRFFVVFMAPQLLTELEKSDLGWWVVRQLENWIIYFGLLGTLVYLSRAIMQLHIHPSTAVMQSIMATMSVTMAQAFLTTITACSLQRIVETLREFVSSSEELIEPANGESP